MRKNGYTLVEVLVSIMILGIIGALLATSFGNIIHFMSKSNNIKVSSNEMYSFFENGLKGTISSSFKRNSISMISYDIISGGNSLTVNGTLTNLESTTESDVYLSNIDYEDRVKLLNDDSYKSFKEEFGKKIYEKTQKSNGVCGFNQCNKESDFNSYVSQLNKDGELPVFDKEYLPIELKNGKEYYVRICYPWKVDFNNFTKPLIYLTQKNNGLLTNEYMQIFYDYEKSIWYYQPINNVYYMLNGGNHEYNPSNNISYATDLTYNGILVDSYDKLKEQVSNPIYGWKTINEGAIVGDYANYWKKVK